jgi:predicted AlkP superfamily pyrophosphatase or phosphodiesterase
MSRIKNLLFTCLFFSAVLAQAQSKQANTSLPRPKLVVGLVVDQMRWDFLYRYYDRYQAGGFKRMLNEGFSCENTMIDYIPTVTAIGHTTIYTGTVPAIHGIAGNDFIIQKTGKAMYCTEDETVQTVGSSSKAGQMSPRNLLTTTITDELKLATNFKSKVIGIALKDRGGILPAGHSADAAYWYDDLTGGWITSTYYMKDLPAWVKNFNDQKKAESYLKQNWNTLYSIDTYTQSFKDNNPYEGKLAGNNQPVFPIILNQGGLLNYKLLRTTPYGNSLTLDMAKAAIENEQLGKSTTTDFLAVSLSSTDYIGHTFGPNSIEVEDTYLRLDQDFAKFFAYLDKTVGKNNYTVFLSADHGCAHNSTLLNDQKIPAGLWPAAKIMAGLNTLLEEKYQTKKLVLSLDNYQVNLNNLAIAEAKLNEQAIISDCIAYLQSQEGVANAIDQKAVQQAPIPDLLRSRIINGYNAERSGAIQLILQPGWFAGYGATGTTHGSWNPYDAHIPLVFMGWGVKHGKTNAPTHMTDIAATLAAILRIQMPNGSIGTPVNELIK